MSSCAVVEATDTFADFVPREHGVPQRELMVECGLGSQSPLGVYRRPVGAQALLGERRQVVGEAHGGVERATRIGEAVHETHGDGLVAADKK